MGRMYTYNLQLLVGFTVLMTTLGHSLPLDVKIGSLGVTGGYVSEKQNDNNDIFNTEQSDQIQGSGSASEGETHQYSYCKQENHPYHYSWSVSGDAIIENVWNSGNCYYSKVKFGSPTRIMLTFNQSNPPGVPQVHNVTKWIQVNKKPSR